MGQNDTNNINSIELSDLTVGEWYKDALLPLPGGPSARPAPATAAAATAANSPTAAAPQKTTAPVTQTTSITEKAPITQTTPPSETPVYKFLGNNRRKTTLLVHSPGTPFLPDNQLTFLTKILEACRMTLADVAIVNHAAAPVTIAAIKQQLQPKIVLLFGLDPTAIRLPINFPHFKQLSYDDCVYLSSPALDLLVPNTEESKLLKSKLWVCLKTIFDV
jgi:hypothetical protein